VLLKQLVPLQARDVEAAAVAFLVTAEPRLLPALEPPLGTAAQPLTLLGLRETAGVAFFLLQMAPLLGPWQAAVQHSPASFRCATHSDSPRTPLHTFMTTSNCYSALQHHSILL
jgi:hypothetical protein